MERFRGRNVTGQSSRDNDRAWARVARNSGYVAALGLFVGSLLYLLDSVDLLGAPPTFHATAAGPIEDEANYWVAYFAHQHHILWDIIARDLLLPLAFVALIFLSLAVRQLVGYQRAEAQLMTVSFLVGGILSALADLTYLAGTDYWRLTGWTCGVRKLDLPANRTVSFPDRVFAPHSLAHASSVRSRQTSSTDATDSAD